MHPAWCPCGWGGAESTVLTLQGSIPAITPCKEIQSMFPSSYKKDGDRPLPVAVGDRTTKSSILNMQQGQFRLDVRKHFLTLSIVKPLRELVESPSLEAFKRWLDKH